VAKVETKAKEAIRGNVGLAQDPVNSSAAPEVKVNVALEVPVAPDNADHAKTFGPTLR
jgi:hypothetical protein